MRIGGANLYQAPKPQNTLLSKTPIMNTTGFRTLSFQSCPVDLLGFQERFDFEPAEQYRRVLAAPAFIPRIFLRLI